MTASCSRVAMRYCYGIRCTKTSPEQINSLWQAEHPAEPMRTAFRVITEGDEDTLFVGVVHDSQLWDTCAGFGCTYVDTDDEALDRALLRFFIEHNELFLVLRYVPADRRPFGPEATDLLLPRVRDDPARPAEV